MMSDAESQSSSPYAAPLEAIPANNAKDNAEGKGDATGGLIPYKNPAALLAYYLGLFSLFPVLGFFLAVPALILGIKGLKKRRADPAVKGAVHAWIGSVMGSICTVIWGLLIISIIAAIFAGR
jgi:hypothetical protein